MDGMDYEDVPMVRCNSHGRDVKIGTIRYKDGAVVILRTAACYLIQATQQREFVAIHLYQVPHPAVDYDTRYAHMAESIYRLKQTPDYEDVPAAHLAQIADKAIPTILCDSFFKMR